MKTCLRRRRRIRVADAIPVRDKDEGKTCYNFDNVEETTRRGSQIGDLILGTRK